jgi:branched-chain amino acid transport system ATP-binding protein
MRMLSIRDLAVKYGDAQILSGVTFDARQGEVSCILGPNGAGKTTLLRSVTGLVPAASGDILFNGQSVKGIKTYDLVQQGLIMVPEGRRLWPSLTVEENLKMGAYLTSDSARLAAQMSYVFELFPHLATRKSQLCGTLSGGEQQMVAVGRGLMGQPKLLLLDEPSLGLAPLVVKEVFKAIEKIACSGTTILLVEQNVHAALSVANYGYVLETGTVVMEGSATDLRENPHVKEAYMGL